MRDESLYHWEGKSLLMDTVVHRKRFLSVDGRRRYFPFDVRRWVTPPEDETMGRAWEQLARAHRRYLDSVSRSQRADVKAKAVWHFVVENIAYQAEEDRQDFWQLPSETLVLRTGDCEDKAFLCASLLLAAGISANRVRVVLGALARREDDQLRYEGHSWPMYCNSHGTWCVLEPNLPHLPIRVTRGAETDPVVPQQAVGIHRGVFLSADRFAADGCREQYVPLVCFNHRNVWTVEPLRHVAAAGDFHPDWTANPTFNQILKPGSR